MKKPQVSEVGLSHAGILRPWLTNREDWWKLERGVTSYTEIIGNRL